MKDGPTTLDPHCQIATFRGIGTLIWRQKTTYSWAFGLEVAHPNLK